MSFKLTLGLYGSVILTRDDEQVWSSEDDSAFSEHFGAFMEEDQVDEVLDYLVCEGKVGDDDEVDIEIEVAEEDGNTYTIPAGE